MTGPVSSVLLVEDEALIGIDAEDMLRGCGVEDVVLVSSYEDAKAQIDARRFDLAIFDLDLDGVSSLPLVEALAASGVPIVVASGYDDPPAILNSLGVPLVQKPLSLARLKLAAQETGTRLPC